MRTYNVHNKSTKTLSEKYKYHNMIEKNISRQLKKKMKWKINHAKRCSHLHIINEMKISRTMR